ncbi:MAG: NAD(P)H-hydrate dehydratase [Caldimicrobium sp.]|nr:NAD(P)H-hydrate dehydratase [Caldimicrobium sp.]MCX7873580.1 NAD(P)H-hydrate dehydratase [Caldimicrobium sp.]MDW8094035.1 NAD(P)H-hydrate dehydratase [Caldimicrobium sp.]
MPLYVTTSEGIQRLDKYVMEEYGLLPEILMERAGLGVAQVVREFFPKEHFSLVTVLSGPGNNGGDGFVCARHLWNWGYEVEVLLFTEEERYRGEALRNLQLLRKLEVPLFTLKTLEEFHEYMYHKKPTLLIDALFGTGLKRPLEGIFYEVISFLKDLRKNESLKVVAVDLPSGISADNGQILGIALPADLTVTFECPKFGHFIYPGKEYVGTLKVVSIGYPWRFLSNEKNLLPKGIYLDASTVREMYRPRKGFYHKGKAGHLLILAGSQGKSGAGYLTALGALRGGAGLVTLASTQSLQPVYCSLLPEILTLGLPESKGEVSYKALEVILENLKGKKVLVIGPGLGLGEEIQRLLFELLPEIHLPVVIDADALTLLAKEPLILKRIKTELVLTPHPGEASRLLNTEVRELLRDPLTALKRLTELANGVVVLKGPHTLIGTPSGDIYVSSIDEPGLSQGGTGDVLTGLIGAFISQGYSPLQASALSVYLHGASGQLLSQTYGPFGYTAKDVADRIPAIIKSLEKNHDEEKTISQIF